MEEAQIDGRFGEHWDRGQKMVLACLFRDYRQAAGHGEASRGISGVPYFSVELSFFLLFDALSCLGLYQDGGGGKKLVRIARRHYRVIKRLSQPSRDFCLSKSYLLRGELSSLSGRRNFDKTMEHYECAIALASKASFVMEEAVACENAGRFLMKCGRHGGRRYFERAHDLLVKWEAWAKADQLAPLLR